VASIEVKRKPGESVESLLRRFRRRLQRSRILNRVKEEKFFQKPKNKRQRKESALARKAARELREYLKKIGKLKE